MIKNLFIISLFAVFAFASVSCSEGTLADQDLLPDEVMLIPQGASQPQDLAEGEG